jgi:hypothetical protein
MQLYKTAGTILVTLAGIILLREGLVRYATTGLSYVNAAEAAAGFILLCGALALCLIMGKDPDIWFRIGIAAVIGGWFLLLGGYGYLKNPGILELLFILAGILVFAAAGFRIYHAIRPAVPRQ